MVLEHDLSGGGQGNKTLNPGLLKLQVFQKTKNMVSVEEGMEIGPKIRVSLNYKFSRGLRTWSEWRRAGKSAVKLI